MRLTLTKRKSLWKAGSVLITNALKHSMLLKLKLQKDFGLTQLPGLAYTLTDLFQSVMELKQLSLNLVGIWSTILRMTLVSLELEMD